MAHHEQPKHKADERPTNVIRHSAWQAKLAAHEIPDQIKVQNLQITANAGVDAWGRPKTQPILLTVTLHLDKPFDSAAQADSLDSSTVHYGQLSKNIIAAVGNSGAQLETRDLTQLVFNSVVGTAGKTELRGIEIDIQYPKGSLMGDAAGYLYAAYTPPHMPVEEFALSRVLYLRDLRIPCIIGVNSNERQQKQPVIVNLWIDCVSPERSDDYTKLEAVLMSVISESAFETLESLSTKVVQELRQKFFGAEDKGNGAFIRLRVEKPLAVPFADAPSIEIVRPVQVY